MIFGIGLLVVSIGAIVAGAGYMKTASRMRSFATTRGAVLANEVGTVPSGDRTEGRWGRGGGAVPKVTYRHTVGVYFVAGGIAGVVFALLVLLVVVLG